MSWMPILCATLPDYWCSCQHDDTVASPSFALHIFFETFTHRSVGRAVGREHNFLSRFLVRQQSTFILCISSFKGKIFQVSSSPYSPKRNARRGAAWFNSRHFSQEPKSAGCLSPSLLLSSSTERSIAPPSDGIPSNRICSLFFSFRLTLQRRRKGFLFSVWFCLFVLSAHQKKKRSSLAICDLNLDKWWV